MRLSCVDDADASKSSWGRPMASADASLKDVANRARQGDALGFEEAHGGEFSGWRGDLPEPPVRSWRESTKLDLAEEVP